MVIGTNTAASVRPPSHSEYAWDYAVFRAYGGGALIEDASPGGAYVIAGTGGHAAPPNFGGALFDFADATWKRRDNANGMPWMVRDLNEPPHTGEIDAFGEITYPGVTSGIPAPAHVYGTVLSQAHGGGARGSALLLHSAAAGSDSNSGSGHAHRFDIATGAWTRLSTNAHLGNSGFRTAAYDPVLDRYYLVRFELHENGGIDYLDGHDWTWKVAAYPTPAADGATMSAFVDEARRLLIMQTSTGKLRALDLDHVDAGVVTLNVVGVLPADSQSRWHRYPPDGCWYTYEGNGGNALHRIVPPASAPLTSTWTVGTVAIAGAALPSQPAEALASGAVHNTRFFYVPSIGCFAWIAGGDQPVVVLKPPPLGGPG
ncbi:MAG: hypothetical protein H0X45_12475 [Planctomycetes bacterium]|nr:hypothetical protein [Planctomycetota bacterium]